MHGFEARQADSNGAVPAMGRREWLRAFVGLFSALSVGFFSAARYPCSAKVALESWLQRLGAGVLGDDAALRRLGAIYLAAHPGEQEHEQLSRLLEEDRTMPVGLKLIDSIGRDWFAQDVTIVDGWVMARTEARICAVLHLLGGART
jgi:hypothetical protein